MAFNGGLVSKFTGEHGNKGGMMDKIRLGTVEMNSSLVVALETLQVDTLLDFTLSRHEGSIRFWVTRLANGYYVFSSLYAPHMDGWNESHPGERFDSVDSVWVEIDSQLDK